MLYLGKNYYAIDTGDSCFFPILANKTEGSIEEGNLVLVLSRKDILEIADKIREEEVNLLKLEMATNGTNNPDMSKTY